MIGRATGSSMHVDKETEREMKDMGVQEGAHQATPPNTGANSLDSISSFLDLT